MGYGVELFAVHVRSSGVSDPQRLEERRRDQHALEARGVEMHARDGQVHELGSCDRLAGEEMDVRESQVLQLWEERSLKRRPLVRIGVHRAFRPVRVDKRDSPELST